MTLHKFLEYKILGVPILFFVLLGALLGFGFLTPFLGIKVWAGVLGLVIVLGVLFTTFTDYKYGLLILVFYAYFLFFIGNILKLNIPVGVPFDLLLFAIAIAAAIKSYNSNKIISNSHPFGTPLGIMLLIWGCYDVVQLINPNTYSVALGISPVRVTIAFLVGFYAFYKAFDDLKFIKLFVITTLALSLFGAIYGLKQEYIGLADWEWEWLTSDPRRYSLMYQWGRVRKWSIFSDVSTFGIVMAFSAISCFILMLGPFRKTYRFLLFFAGLLMIMAMSYSGTRTATAMLPLGLGIYFLMNMNNKVTVGVAVLAGLVFLAIMYGPFYGPTLTRIRSTFNSDDPSLGFREYKRKKLQNYVYTHPIGGGLGTANETAGRLSTTYDPDNGYLRTALDKGMPGLLIQLALFFTILWTAVTGYYNTESKKIRILFASFIGSFFAISVAQFFQDAVEQKPVNFIIISFLAMIVRLKEVDQKLP